MMLLVLKPQPNHNLSQQQTKKQSKVQSLGCCGAKQFFGKLLKQKKEKGI